MSWETTIALSCANTAAVVSEIYTRLTAMGWTDHDDQSGATPPFYVFKSAGESGVAAPIYIKMQWNSITDDLQWNRYNYWDNSDQTYDIRMPASAGLVLNVDDDASQTIWIHGNKDGFVVCNKIGSTYQQMRFHLGTKHHKAYGVLSGAVTSGSDKVVTLGSGETADFYVGRSYKICGIGDGEGVENAVVDAINHGSNTLTLDSLTRGYSSGSVIGVVPNMWVGPWLANNSSTYGYIQVHQGTGDSNGTVYPYGQSIGNGAFWDPCPLNQLYGMRTQVVKENTGGQGGFLHWIGTDEYFLEVYSCDNEDTFTVGELDSGTATAGAATTLTDTGKSWTTNEFQNLAVCIDGGTGAGQIRTITSNTGTVLTVPTWTTNPSTDSTYVLCQKAYRAWDPAANREYACFEGGTI